MSTVNKSLRDLTQDDIERISIEYLKGWHDLMPHGFRLKGFNKKRCECGLVPLTTEMSDEYRVDYIKSHYSQQEIVHELSSYIGSHKMNESRWDGIDVLGCHFGREYCRLFKMLLGSVEYRKLSEQLRVSKLADTQVRLYGGIGLGSVVTRKKAQSTASLKKWQFLQQAVKELNEHHCILTTFANSSVFEVFAYKFLIDKFGKDDILIDYGVHPYDERYPYVCDFYIKSLDLFIELNVHFTHGGHWYDENSSADVLRVKHLTSVGSKRDEKFIDTWLKRDVEKRNVAKASEIKYLVFWDGTTRHQGNVLIPNLKDFMSWLVDYDCDYNRFIKDHPENTY